jgi:hypothetical protein
MDHAFATGRQRARQFKISGLYQTQLNALAPGRDCPCFAGRFCLFETRIERLRNE